MPLPSMSELLSDTDLRPPPCPDTEARLFEALFEALQKRDRGGGS